MATRDITTTRPTVQRRLAQLGLDYPARWGLIAHHPLREPSGPRGDKHGSHHLSDINTVTTADGPLWPVASFASASSERLQVDSNALLQTGDIDFWGAARIYANGFAATSTIASKSNGSTAAEWTVQVATTGVVTFFGFDATGTSIGGASTAALSLSTWYLLVWYHSAATNQVGISVNGGAWSVAATNANPIVVGATRFTVGARGAATPDRYWNGRVGEVSFGKNPSGGVIALRDEIRDTLNANRAYPWAA
jgi:hypothetical protein